MKQIIASAFLVAFILSCSPKKKLANDLAISNPIATHINITNVSDDKVPVIINPGRFTADTVTYHLPKVVQGTYKVSNFGRFIDDFKALDYNGNPLNVNHPDDNTWVITNASQLDKITYLVNDTFDVENSMKDVPFSPSGTNIEPENYVLNLHGFIGFFDSLKNNQYTLDVTAPSSFIRTSALQETNAKQDENNNITVSHLAPRYFDITDNPMMYGKLDVEEFMVGDIKIVLSVYSPNKTHTASGLKKTIYKMMQGQKAYLGDVNSTARYDIYLYLAQQNETAPTGFGALEHHTSTVVVMPETIPKEALEKSMTDIVSHEFFHIVTPLSVHSEDVHYFDYDKPTFSKHLWMYEGITEYFAQHFQVYEGLVTQNEFLKAMDDKIKTSKRFDDAMSFTTMSENILDKPYSDNYINVYQKGALIGMCIDILMREESNGTRSMLSLMKELSSKYGKNNPFVDDNIIAEISAMTYPSVSNFLKTHVEGTTPINYDEFFNKLGVKVSDSKVETTYIQAGDGYIFDGDQNTGTLFFSKNVENNSFWKEQGVQVNDVIKTINGAELTLQNAQMLIGQMYFWKPGQDIEVTLERNGEPVIIKTKLTQAYTKSKVLAIDENATEAQNKLRNAWLKG